MHFAFVGVYRKRNGCIRLPECYADCICEQCAVCIELHDSKTGLCRLQQIAEVRVAERFTADQLHGTDTVVSQLFADLSEIRCRHENLPLSTVIAVNAPQIADRADLDPCSTRLPDLPKFPDIRDFTASFGEQICLCQLRDDSLLVI